ncbi:hypothetical protein [Leifsonia sp. NPDC058248]
MAIVSAVGASAAMVFHLIPWMIAGVALTVVGVVAAMWVHSKLEPTDV